MKKIRIPRRPKRLPFKVKFAKDARPFGSGERYTSPDLGSIPLLLLCMLGVVILTVGVMLQAAINFGAMSGIFPTKGMPAPFISYGGSNLLGCMISTGILVAISAYTDNPGYRCFWRRRIDDEEGEY